MEPASAQDYAAAGQHFDAAQEAFQKADYRRAAAEYQAAYQITKDSALLMSIGESWQRAGEATRALEAYRAYLKAQPDASDRAEIEKRVAALEAAQAAAQTATQAPSTGVVPAPGTPAATTEPPPAVPPPGTPPAAAAVVPPPAVDPPTSGGSPPVVTPPSTQTEAPTSANPPSPVKPTEPFGRLRAAGWISVASAVALGTAGAIVGLGAQNRADELRRRTTLVIAEQPPVYDANQREAYEALMSEGRSYNAASIALFSVAGVTAVASAAFFIADYVKTRRSTASTTERQAHVTRAFRTPRMWLLASGSPTQGFLGLAGSLSR